MLRYVLKPANYRAADFLNIRNYAINLIESINPYMIDVNIMIQSYFISAHHLINMIQPKSEVKHRTKLIRAICPPISKKKFDHSLISGGLLVKTKYQGKEGSLILFILLNFVLFYRQ